MIAPPNTYAQWAALLTTFAAGTADEEAVHAMRAGTLVWQSSVAERFTQRLLDALNTRIQKDSDTFSRDLARASAEQDTIAALLAQRRRFRTLYAAADLPALPAATRKETIAAVQTAADRTQESLEASAKTDRTGRMSALVRSHRVNVLETEAFS